MLHEIDSTSNCKNSGIKAVHHGLSASLPVLVSVPDCKAYPSPDNESHRQISSQEDHIVCSV